MSSLAIYMYGDSGFAPMMFVFSGCGKCLLVFADVDLAAQAELVLHLDGHSSKLLLHVYLYFLAVSVCRYIAERFSRRDAFCDGSDRVIVCPRRACCDRSDRRSGCVGGDRTATASTGAAHSTQPSQTRSTTA